MKDRRKWISADDPIPVSRQCDIAGTNRSTFYLPPRLYEPDAEELHLLDLIDQEYTLHPFYGSRRMTHYLRRQGFRINRKRVQRLMLQLGLSGIRANPKTSEPHPEHQVFPYLLRGVKVSRPPSSQAPGRIRTSRPKVTIFTPDRSQVDLRDPRCRR